MVTEEQKLRKRLRKAKRALRAYGPAVEITFEQGGYIYTGKFVPTSVTQLLPPSSLYERLRRPLLADKV